MSRRSLHFNQQIGLREWGVSLVPPAELNNVGFDLHAGDGIIRVSQTAPVETLCDAFDAARRYEYPPLTDLSVESVD